MLLDLGLQRLPDLLLFGRPTLHPLLYPLEVAGEPIQLMHHLILIARLVVSEHMGLDLLIVELEALEGLVQLCQLVAQ